MPKFLVTRGSYFQPFTYDELVKPLQQMADAQNTTQDAYDTLNMETEALRQYIMQEPEDSYARQLYDNYTQRLSTLQNNLWNNGYTPQTRRDLSLAKAGYADGITRLQTAIKNRQDRSNEYWKTRHDHPDMIMGTDPGLGSLDDYLKDDRFGQNYYSYSGQQFMTEVGADAKARASEMLRDPYVTRDPNLVGYLTRISQEGFTNAEVDAASFAVKAAMNGDSSLLRALDPASAILANVLTSHLESTGAAGNVSPEEMNRLLDYGHSGLSQAVGSRKDDVIADKQWAINAELDMARKKAEIDLDTYRQKNKIDGEDSVEDEGGNERGYETNAAYQRLLSKTAQKTSADMDDKFHKNFRDENGDAKSVPIRLPNNGLMVAENATDATEQIYNNDHRKRILDEMGLDIAVKGYGLFRTNKSKQFSPDGRFMTDDLPRSDEKRLGLDKGAVAVKEYVNGKWVLNDGYTMAFNRAKREYDGYVNQTKQLNPDLNLSDYVILPDQEKKMRKKYDISDSVPLTDLETAIERKEIDQTVVAPQLVGTGMEYDDARQRYARLIDDFYGGLSGANGLGDSSIGAFYKVGEGGYDASQKGETDKAKVFTLTKDGHVDPNCISSIYMLPQDVNDEDTKFRIRVLDKNGKGTDWVVSSKMFGPAVASVVNNASFVSSMRALMTPISQPVEILGSSDEDSAIWSVGALSILANRFPVDENDDYPTAKDILRNDYLYDMYLKSVNSYVQDILSIPLDRQTLGVRQHPGYTSTKATSNLQ